MSETNFNKLQTAYWRDEIQKQRRDPRHPIVKAYVEPKLRYICSKIDLGKNSTVLEVGGGNGYFSYYLDRISQLTATDFSPVILEQNPVGRKSVMDARNLQFSDRSFDIVFCHALLHHIDPEERAAVVKEMKRVARRYVVAIEPNIYNPLMALFGLLKKEERGSLVFSPQYLKKLFTDTGLSVVSERSFGLLTPNRMPIPKFLLPLEAALFEKPLWNGICNILIVSK